MKKKTKIETEPKSKKESHPNTNATRANIFKYVKCTLYVHVHFLNENDK